MMKYRTRSNVVQGSLERVFELSELARLLSMALLCTNSTL